MLTRGRGGVGQMLTNADEGGGRGAEVRKMFIKGSFKVKNNVD